MDLYYKVVFRKTATCDIRSAISGVQEIYYKIGDFTYPKIKGSKLFVFKDLESARKYITFTRFLIYSCEVLNPIPQKMALSLALLSRQDNIELFWKNETHCGNNGFYRDCSLMDTPNGSYSCDAVKLIEEIK